MRDEMRRNFLGIEISVKHMLENGLIKGNDTGNESEVEFEEYKPSTKNKPSTISKNGPVVSILNPLDEETIAQKNEEEKEETNYALADILF